MKFIGFPDLFFQIVGGPPFDVPKFLSKTLSCENR